MKIKLTSVYVADQEKALRFYTDVLGFVKKADFSQGPYRWLTVASPEEPDGTELQLALNDNPAAAAYQQAMLQQSQPDDYVISTGQTHSVRELCELAFSHVGLDYKDYVVLDERYMRPAEVDLLIGDPTKAREHLGWQPETSFEELVKMMVEADLKLVRNSRG